MAVPSAGVTFSYIKALVGDQLGHGYGEAREDPVQGRREGFRIHDAAVGGIQTFYNPPILPGETTAYRWAFLRPILQVTLPSGSQAAALPPGFVGLEGPAQPEATDGSSQSFWPVTRTNERRIRYLYGASPTATGRPCEMAEEWGQKSGGRSQQCRLIVFPKADQEYLLRFSCCLNPSADMGDDDTVWGGSDHEQTVLASCLAWAELKYDGAAKGPLYMDFMEKLGASISRDRQRKGDWLGYNGDGQGRRWDRRPLGNRSHDHTLHVTYRGVLYS